MKLSIAAAIAALLALGAQPVLADTRSSDQDRATMEDKASPANPVKQDEEQAEAHGRPDTPASTGGSTEPSAGDASASAPATAEDANTSSPKNKPTTGDYYQSNENKADSTKSSQ